MHTIPFLAITNSNPPDAEIFMDTAGLNLGFGAIFEPEWLMGCWHTLNLQTNPHINALELFTVLQGITTWKNRL